MTEPERDDEVLLARIRRGDLAAFEQLFRAYHASLCDVAHRYVRSPAVAEDVVQDVFFRFWSQRERLDVQSVRGYLFVSVRNACLQLARHESLRGRLLRRLGFGTALAGVADEPIPIDAQFDLTERDARLHEALAQLPSRSQQAMRLRWVDQRSHVEIAREMGISVKGVEKLLATGKRLLRDMLDGSPELTD